MTGGHDVSLCVTFHAYLSPSFPRICLQMRFRIAAGGLARGFGGCVRSSFPKLAHNLVESVVLEKPRAD